MENTPVDTGEEDVASSRCVWLLDVDGVLNGFGRCGWSAPPATSRIFADGVGWRMRWAPQLIDRIRAIHETGRVEIRWATTWIDHDVTRIEQIMSLPAFATAYPKGSTAPGGHSAAKLAAARAVLRTGRRLIWTDDDAIPSAGPDRNTLDAAGALLIAPDLRRGLRPEHLDAIETYLRVDADHGWR